MQVRSVVLVHAWFTLVPAAHVEQVVHIAAPATEKLPPGHALHDALPVPIAYVPAAHTEQLAALVPLVYVPAVHGVQVRSVVALHAWFTLVPAAQVAQVVQLAAPEAE